MVLFVEGFPCISGWERPSNWREILGRQRGRQKRMKQRRQRRRATTNKGNPVCLLWRRQQHHWEWDIADVVLI